MKHNNAIPRAHFRKEWERRVKTWFNQPGRKQRRRENRVAKAARVYPRPVNALRPVVQAPTKKYNAHSRLGRGFTREELKAAGLNHKYARSIGISTDKRRKNRSEESLQRNVARLKEYVGKLVLFPVKAKKPTKRDSDAAALKAATQFKGDINRIASPKSRRSSSAPSPPPTRRRRCLRVCAASARSPRCSARCPSTRRASPRRPS
jgi:large subunit ribosomal protein L13e